MQHIGEGVLEIPEQWHNQSVNIFTAHGPGTPGTSITINRDRLPFGATLKDYATTQSGKLAKQLNRFELIGTESLEVDGRAAEQYEFTWHTEDAGPVHQVLVCVENGPALLNLTATHSGRMSEGQLAHVKHMLHSLKFDPADPPSN